MVTSTLAWKRFFTFVIPATILFSIESCKKNISPKGSIPQKYSVNIILSMDTTFQTAYISSLYGVERFDPHIKKLIYFLIMDSQSEIIHPI